MRTIKFVDDFLNAVTMYRLVLYFLLFLFGAAFILSFFGIFSFGPLALAASAVFLIAVSWITNKIFARVFEAPTNIESVYITAFILTLIITPAKSFADFAFLFWAAVLAVASKFILAIGKKHIFNPAAFGVAVCALTLGASASWWVGTFAMFPAIFFGVLIVRKIIRQDLVFCFLISSFGAILLSAFFANADMVSIFRQVLFDSPILFFAFVMLTEPQTTPPTKNLRIMYGLIAGLLFAPQIHFGSFYITPEIALLTGNLFSYVVSPGGKLILAVRRKKQLSADVWEFDFGLKKKLSFAPGQYMEWTLAHKNPDSRGNRRFFTIASSPTEDTLRLGVKFYPEGSSFKRALLTLGPKTPVVAGLLAGDFTLPKEEDRKLVFIAGGIGVTPYRSIIKYLLDSGRRRDIVLLYSARTPKDIVYSDVFESAREKLGIKTVYTVTENAPAGWKGRVGRIDEEVIKGEVGDWQERTFYLSGPHGMVKAFEDVLGKMGVPRSQIKTDFFPGYV